MRNIGKKILMQSERYGVKALSIGSTGISALLPCLYVAVPAVLQSGRGMTVEGAAPDNSSPICLTQILRFWRAVQIARFV
jgi:hypothetical protein